MLCGKISHAEKPISDHICNVIQAMARDRYLMARIRYRAARIRYQVTRIRYRLPAFNFKAHNIFLAASIN